MADITPQVATWNGTTNPVMTGAEPDATQTIKKVNPNTTVVILNNSANPLSVLLKNQVQDDWSLVVTTQDQTHAIAAGEMKVLSGPFLCEKFRDSDGDVIFTTSIQTDIAVYAFHRGP